MSTQVTTRVVFIDPQPRPDNTGSPITTFDHSLPSMKDWVFEKQGDDMVIKDNTGHELRVPYVRVRQRFVTQVN